MGIELHNVNIMHGLCLYVLLYAIIIEMVVNKCRPNEFIDFPCCHSDIIISNQLQQLMNKSSFIDEQQNNENNSNESTKLRPIQFTFWETYTNNENLWSIASQMFTERNSLRNFVSQIEFFFANTSTVLNWIRLDRLCLYVQYSRKSSVSLNRTMDSSC